jgi:hypothetical protein
MVNDPRLQLDEEGVLLLSEEERNYINQYILNSVDWLARSQDLTQDQIELNMQQVEDALEPMLKKVYTRTKQLRLQDQLKKTQTRTAEELIQEAFPETSATADQAASSLSPVDHPGTGTDTGTATAEGLTEITPQSASNFNFRQAYQNQSRSTTDNQQP